MEVCGLGSLPTELPGLEPRWGISQGPGPSPTGGGSEGSGGPRCPEWSWFQRGSERPGPGYGAGGHVTFLSLVATSFTSQGSPSGLSAALPSLGCTSGGCTQGQEGGRPCRPSGIFSLPLPSASQPVPRMFFSHLLL